MRQKRVPAFATEADLCAAFIAWAEPQGWTAYAETADFDILLVHGDGTQIGIQAKLKFNIKVLAQILPHRAMWGDGPGPDYRAVLVPEGAEHDICSALGVTAFQLDRHARSGADFAPEIGERCGWPDQGWHFMNPVKRCALPAYVPDVIAGSSAPTQLTKWKISALRVAATLEIRSYLTRNDFRREGIDHRRWTQDWLVPGPQLGQWIAGPRMPTFATQHPVVYPKVRAEVAKLIAVEIAA